MLKNIWSVLCLKSVIDSETNNITLRDVFEQLDVEYDSKKNKPPILLSFPIEYEVTSLWSKKNNLKEVQSDVEIRVFSPSAKLVKTFPFKLNIEAKYKRYRSRFKIKGIQVSESGDYLFTIFVKEKGETTFKQVFEIPLEVNLVPKP